MLYEQIYKIIITAVAVPNRRQPMVSTLNFNREREIKSNHCEGPLSEFIMEGERSLHLYHYRKCSNRTKF